MEFTTLKHSLELTSNAYNLISSSATLGVMGKIMKACLLDNAFAF